MAGQRGGPLLIGENGTGKTTLLECLAWMRPEPDEDKASKGTTGPELPGVSTPLTDEENEVLETLPWKGSRRVKIGVTLSFGIGLEPNGSPHRANSKAKDWTVGRKTQLRSAGTFDRLGATRQRQHPQAGWRIS